MPCEVPRDAIILDESKTPLAQQMQPVIMAAIEAVDTPPPCQHLFVVAFIGIGVAIVTSIAH
jgi:hypothetical protein